MMKSNLFKLLAVVFISFLGIIVYSNTFHCSFQFDDNFSIIDNIAIRHIHDLQSIWNFLPRRFILYLSLALNYHFNGLEVFGYHIFNLAVHLISAILVWWLTLLTLSTPAMKENKITRHANLIALFAGLIFVSHPVQTQAVTYIVQRAASMATMFYIASVCFYVKSRLLQSNRSSSGLSKFYYVLSLLAAVVAMFTKETAITIPLTILLYEFSFLRTKQGFKWGASIPFLLALLIIPLTMLLTETGAVRLQQLRNEPGISSMHYLLTQFRVIVTYIRLLFIPLHQNLDYDYPVSQSFFEWPTLSCFLLLTAILFCAKRLFTKYRLISFSIFWFFLTLLPESSFLPIRDVIYEHRLYLPLVGYSMFLASGVYYGIDLFYRASRPFVSLGMTIVLLILIVSCNSFLTYQRNKIWKDEISLWSDTLRKSPHKARPYNNRGNAYFRKGNFKQAMLDFNKAITIDPYYADAYYNRGNVNTIEGHYAPAILDFDEAIRINPHDAGAYNNRGSIYNKQNKLAQALSDYNKAIEINPNYTDAYYNRGNIYTKQGKFNKAALDFKKVIEINPKDTQAYNSHGNTYDKQNNLTQAMIDFNKAIEINPQDALGYCNRGGVYAKQGNFTQAIFDFNRAIEIDPNIAEGYYNRGLAHDKQGDPAAAISDYNKAVKINPQYEEAYYNRGIIYDKEGRFPQAILDYGKAIQINPKNTEYYNNRGIIYAKQSKYAQALADFTQAIKIDPKDAEAYNNRGLTYDKEGKSAHALSDYDQAIELNPHYAEAYFNRGIIYANQDNFVQAVSEYTKALEINPNYANAENNRAISYYQLKEYDRAWVDAHKAERSGFPVNPKFMTVLKQALGQ